MTPVTNIREQLARDEGERLKLYLDTEGLRTIGIGRCIDRTPFTPEEAAMCGCPDSDNLTDLLITREACDLLFENDLRSKDAELRRALPWAVHLDEARYGVLLNMAFNLGVGSREQGTGLLGFPKFLAAMQAGNWTAAGIHMLDSKWAGQVGDRAVRLRRQVETGLWV